jgi:hypothetical protein
VGRISWARPQSGRFRRLLLYSGQFPDGMPSLRRRGVTRVNPTLIIVTGTWCEMQSS